jgi:hypothetical protein
LSSSYPVFAGFVNHCIIETHDTLTHREREGRAAGELFEEVEGDVGAQAPERLAVVVAEEDGPDAALALHVLRGPALRPTQDRQRDLEDARDLAGVRAQRRGLGEAPQDGRDGHVVVERGEVIQQADDLDQRGVEVDLLLGLAERGGDLIGVLGLERAAREGDLALVGGERLGAARQDQARGLPVVDEGDEDRSVARAAQSAARARGERALELGPVRGGHEVPLWWAATGTGAASAGGARSGRWS